MNVSIWLTLARLPLTLFAILALTLGWSHHWLVAAILVNLVGNTDFVDGWLARRLGKVTTLGTNLDLFCDKICLGALLITMAWLKEIPIWMPVAVITREITVSVVRVIRFRSHPPPSDIWGRAKTGLTLTAIVLLLLRRGLTGIGGLGAWLLNLGPWLMLAAVALTLLSGVNYLVRYSWSAHKEIG